MPGNDFHDRRRCPYCGSINDGQADTSGSGFIPRAGDHSICAYCREVSIFTESGLRKPTLEEQAIIACDPDVSRAKRALADRLKERHN